MHASFLPYYLVTFQQPNKMLVIIYPISSNLSHSRFNTIYDRDYSALGSDRQSMIRTKMYPRVIYLKANLLSAGSLSEAGCVQ